MRSLRYSAEGLQVTPSALIMDHLQNWTDRAEKTWLGSKRLQVPGPWTHKWEGHQLRTPCWKAPFSEEKHFLDCSTLSLCHCWWVCMGSVGEQRCQLSRFSYPSAKRNKELKRGEWGEEKSYYISSAKIFLALINTTWAKAKNENAWTWGDSHSIYMLQLW